MAVVLGGLSLLLRELFLSPLYGDAWQDAAIPLWFGEVFLQYVCLAVLLAGIIQILWGPATG